jgi:DinB superfamily
MTTVENPFEKARPKLVAARREFLAQLAQFAPDDLPRRPVEGEWSPLQLAYHLYITDGLALEELKRVQNEDNPLVVPTDVEAPRLTNAGAPPPTLDIILAGLAARREEIFEYLSTLPPSAWERPFRHHEWGQRKFYQMVNIMFLHDQMHAQQLAAQRVSSAEA